MDAFDAIYVRRSCRAYASSPLAADELAEITDLAESSTRLFPDVAMRTWVVPGEPIAAISKGLIAAYGAVEAPHFIVATAERRAGGRENVGFALEPVVLSLTSQGYGTCWIGAQARPELIAKVVEAPAEQELVVVIAVGRPASPAGHLREPGTGMRTPLGEITLDDCGAFVPLLEAARLAPSAMNSQPWRFLCEKEAVHVFRPRRHPLPLRLAGERLLRMNRVDCGIALAHIALAAAHGGSAVRFEVRDAPTHTDLVYVATAVFG